MAGTLRARDTLKSRESGSATGLFIYDCVQWVGICA